MFTIGSTILHEGTEYMVKEVLGLYTIRFEIKEQDIISKKFLEKCIAESDEPEFCISKWFVENKKLTHPQFPYVRNAKPETGVSEIRKLRRLDEFKLNEIIEVLDFAIKDPFWKEQVFTLSQIRTKSQSNKMSKFENIKAALNRQRVYDQKKHKDEKPLVYDGAELDNQ